MTKKRPLLKIWHDVVGHKNCYIDYEWRGDHGVTTIKCDACGLNEVIFKHSKEDYERLLSWKETLSER